jgi:hypothetical protein
MAQLVHNGLTTITRPGGPPPIVIGSQHDTAYNVYDAFASGEDFGRWLAYPYFTFTQYSGTGQFNGAYRDTVALEGGYALFRSLDMLSGVGLDRLYYNTIPPVRREDELWNIGLRWTPNPNSSVTALYGRKDGYTAPYLDANYSPSGRTRLFATYSVSISTDQQQLLTSLLNASFNALGDATDLQTGEPVLLSDNFFGVSTTVYKLTAASFGAALMADRDTYVVSFRNQQRDVLGAVLNGHGSNAGSSAGSYGSLHWQHELNPALSGTLYGQYGVLTTTVSNTPSTQHVLVAAATMTWQIAGDLNAGLLASQTEKFLRGAWRSILGTVRPDHAQNLLRRSCTRGSTSSPRRPSS